MITPVTYIISAFIVLIVGIIIGAIAALAYAFKELEKIDKKYDDSVKHYKDIANTAMRCASKYETRCKELESKYGEPHVQ